MEWILRSARRSWRDETDACWREICNRSMYWPSVNAAAAWSANPLMERGLMIGLLIAPEASLNFLYEKETIKSNLLSRRHQMELETEKKESFSFWLLYTIRGSRMGLLVSGGEGTRLLHDQLLLLATTSKPLETDGRRHFQLFVFPVLRTECCEETSAAGRPETRHKTGQSVRLDDQMLSGSAVCVSPLEILRPDGRGKAKVTGTRASPLPQHRNIVIYIYL